MTELDTVAFDIETTGFAVEDQRTVIGFDAAVGFRIFLNTGSRLYLSAIGTQVNEEPNPSVSVSVEESEQIL